MKRRIKRNEEGERPIYSFVKVRELLSPFQDPKKPQHGPLPRYSPLFYYIFSSLLPSFFLSVAQSVSRNIRDDHEVPLFLRNSHAAGIYFVLKATHHRCTRTAAFEGMNWRIFPCSHPFVCTYVFFRPGKARQQMTSYSY